MSKNEFSSNSDTMSIEVIVDINKTTQGLLKLFFEKFVSPTDMIENLHTLKQEFEAFNIQNFDLKQNILKAAPQIYKKIEREVKYFIPTIMLKSATRNGQNFFLVSLSFIKNAQIIERTIGLITNEDKLPKLLTKVGLTEEQILMINSDQGSNLLKTENLKTEAKNALRIVKEISTNKFPNNDEMKEIFDIIEDLENEDNEKEPEKVEIVDDDFGSYALKFVIHQVMSNYEDKITKIREVATNLMKENFDFLCDVQFSLSNTFLVIKEIKKFKRILQNHNNSELMLTDDIWAFIDEYLLTFKSVDKTIKETTKENLTINEFYIKWQKMQNEIQKIADGEEKLKSNVFEAFKSQEQKFLQNETFLGALVLDPRFKNFNDEQIEKATEELERIYEIAKYSDDDPTNIREEIAKFLNHKTEINADDFKILEFWQNKKNDENFKGLFEVSQVIFGAAILKKNKDFDGFALVYEEIKKCLNDEEINSVLIVKNNLELLDGVKFY
ncbi:hypothetical protein PVAND_015456 [Polypedilum vanderplanki]|uniref:Uncharacterized protein n=1 Tax=Polypedilum vanderplanki TaxID=319348 RepID=A0A9J6BCA2_POLVA|nr:hypothetical protein PVAND_015456 [Polypedilum vanderplanki]